MTNRRFYTVAAITALAIVMWSPRGVISYPTEQAVDTSAKFGGKTSEWLVTNAAGGSTLTGFRNRKAVELQNLGPNAIYCTVDGQAPLATGALGRRIDASGGTWTLDAGSGITIKCIAATAAQVSGAATQVTELR